MEIITDFLVAKLCPSDQTELNQILLENKHRVIEENVSKRKQSKSELLDEVKEEPPKKELKTTKTTKAVS